jgi:GWxTD domain-containing protein
MKKTIILLGITFSLFLLAGKSSSAPKDSRMLSFDADYAAFRIPGDTTDAYIEIHYDLRRNQLKYEPVENGYEAILDFQLNLKDRDGKLLDSLSWKAANTIAKLSSLDNTGYLISDMISDKLPAGFYRVELFVTNGNKTGAASFPMEVPVFKGDRPMLSSLELAYQIKPDTSGKFVKNGLHVMPNPSSQFLQDNKKVNFYAEGYGLDTTAAADSMFFVSMEILTPDGQLVKSMPPISYHKPGESAVIATDFPIDSLKSGDYDLRVKLSDGVNNVTAIRQFSVVVSHEVARTAMMNGLLRDYPEANNIVTTDDAKKFRDEIVLIATPDELKLFDSLNLTGKAAFQKDFWNRRNPDPNSSQNAFELEHYRRVKYVSENYGQFKGGHAGWKTDRGRVYVMYGEPSDIERYPQSLEARAWERWWYNGLEGGVYFIFVDFENAEDYTLVHSSKRDEVKDESWEEKIKMSVMQR